jgi:hypothetical protein
LRISILLLNNSIFNPKMDKNRPKNTIIHVHCGPVGWQKKYFSVFYCYFRDSQLSTFCIFQSEKYKMSVGPHFNSFISSRCDKTIKIDFDRIITP